MGATVTGLDLNDISDEDLEALRAATHKYQLVLIKDQHNLDPVKHWDLISRLDPTAPQVHGYGTVKDFKETGEMLSKREVHGIPVAPNVRIIGKGYQGDDHFGIKNFTATGASNDYHRYPPTKEAFEAGNTQFQRWHIDAPLYAREPPRYTALRATRCLVGPELNVNWDDGSGLSMKCKAGQTAFVEYAPLPYMWIENCKGRPSGLGLETEGLEHTMDEMPEWDPKKIKTYPMVWMTPTGEKALQVHTICVRKMYLKATPSSEVKIIDNIVEIGKLLYGWYERIIRPEYILMSPVEEGDVQMWDNWSIFHTAIDYPDHYGSRTMYQANLGASVAPVGPVRIPVS